MPLEFDDDARLRHSVSVAPKITIVQQADLGQSGRLYFRDHHFFATDSHRLPLAALVILRGKHRSENRTVPDYIWKKRPVGILCLKLFCRVSDSIVLSQT